MKESRGQLEADRQRTLRRLEDLTIDFNDVVASSRDTNADDEHDPEGATIAFERAQIGALIRQAQAHLDEIDAAIRRLARGTYGVCEVCDQPIAPGRLEARPMARACIVCASLS